MTKQCGRHRGVREAQEQGHAFPAEGAAGGPERGGVKKQMTEEEQRCGRLRRKQWIDANWCCLKTNTQSN
tara:strand:+ start:430 stop:639 length:210 start_codon:yes stop_codon:yes gene_type:complete